MSELLKDINVCDENCPVRRSLQLLSGKWTLLVLYQISGNTVRYGELRRRIPGISEKMLIQELNTLLENGFALKKSYPEIPPRVEYRLTEKGLNTIPIIEQLAVFGLKHLV